MSGPVVTTDAHLVYAGARIHSNNTAEMSAIVEALSFLGPHGPVARDACSCVFYDSKHAVGVCLGTSHARTHGQLGLSCQQLSLKVQLRPLFTMQRFYSHAENLGNECSDHAAALGTFGLVSNHNLSARWNPILGLLFHVQIGGIFEENVEEIDLARIALSCHFALGFLCDKPGTHDSA